jgi:ABC-2 type transport system permease protein
MKRQQLKKQNIIHLIAALLIIILLNYISSFLFKRFDLTSEKRYTLSDFTKNLLSETNQKIYITIYLEGNDLPISFKNMKNSVKELLDEFVVYSETNIDYEFVNPTDEEKTEEERRLIYLQLYNLGIVPVESDETTEGQSTKTMIFPSAVMTYTAYIPNGTKDGTKDTLVSVDIGINLLNNDPNFLQTSEENINNSIQALEYKLINEIQKISRLEKPNIAFIEGHGELAELEVLEMSSTLSEYYNVMRGEINGIYGILDKFEAIIIAKPTTEFSKVDKFVLDQYIMNGGKVLWLVDGVNVDMDSIYFYQHTFAMPSNVEEINLIDQLFKYGVRINTDIVQDMYCSTILLKGVSATGEERDHYYNWYYFPVLLTSNDHVINKYIDVVKTEFVSTIDTVGENQEVKKTILMTTSEFSRKLNITMPVEIDFDEINNVPDETVFNSGKQPVAVLLEGKFESAFKNQNIKEYLVNQNLFKDKSIATKQIVIADGDIIKNVVTTANETYPLGFDKYSLYTFNGNEEFLLNTINYLCDDEGLMTLRSREFKLRLLDKTKVDSQKFIWQLVNTLLPVVLIITFGIIVFFARRKKYTK